MKLKSLFLLAALGLLCASVLADEVVIDFEGASIPLDPGYFYTSSYTEDGFIISSSRENGMALSDMHQGTNSSGSQSLWLPSRPNPPIVLTLQQLSGEPFCFKSLWIGQILGTIHDIRPLEIRGFYSDGGEVLQGIDPIGGAWTQYFLDPSFTDLVQVTINLHPIPPEFPDMPTLASPSMDNLVLCRVPEPSTLLLLSGGLGLVSSCQILCMRFTDCDVAFPDSATNLSFPTGLTRDLHLKRMPP